MKLMSNGKSFTKGAYTNAEKANAIKAGEERMKAFLSEKFPEIYGEKETAVEKPAKTKAKKFNLSAICKTANTLRKQGYTLSQAFIAAWVIAKGQETKISGTSFENRQAALEHLMKYKPEEVSFRLVKENNRYDKNAVAVMVSANGSAEFKIGYIPAATAPIVAAILNKGIDIKTKLKGIFGGYAEYAKLGLRLNMSF